MTRKEPTEYKTFPSISLKVNEEQGIVEHIITLFGVLDHGHDISHPGCFTKTLAERGDKIQVLDMHKTSSIRDILGKPLELREIGRDELPKRVLEEYPEATGGLRATTKYFIDTPEGKGAFIRAKEDAVEYSYGYDALDTDEADVKRNGETIRARNLRTLRLWEYGPVIFGMCPGTTTLSAKSENAPSEAKPAPDVTENTIRIRVRAPGDFEKDSFRTINIGGADSGIKATVGKLKGETTMTIQSYIFAKDKFSVEEAQAWVDEHKKDALPEMDEKQEEGPYQCECLECGYTMESEEHCRDVKCPECDGEMRRAERPGKEGDEPSEVSAAWTTAYMNDLPDSSFLYIAPGGEKDEEGKTKPRNLRYFPYKDADGNIDLPHLRNAIARIPQSNAPGLDDAKKNALQERARRMLEDEREKSVEPTPEVKETPEEVVFASVILQNVLMKLEGESWEQKAAELAIEKLRALYSDGKTEDEIAEMEAKAGRVLSARNATKIANALTALIEVLENAGIDIPGYGKEPGPMTPPKGKDLRLEMEILGAELDILELE